MKFSPFLLLLFSAASHAAGFCDHGVLNTLMKAYPHAEMGDYGERLHLHDKRQRIVSLYDTVTQCKIWPARPELAIIAVKADTAFNEEESREAIDADLELFIVSVKQNKILSHYTERGTLSSDAIYVSQIKLDTARYKLNENTTAFGVRILKSGSSSVNPFSMELLSLYFYDHQQVSRVMSYLKVSSDGGEYDGRCDGDFSSDKSVIMMGKNKQHDHFAPLIVKTTRQSYTTTMVQGECIQSNQPEQKLTHILRYRQGIYQVPDAIAGF
ncbi:hypothetical protein VA7868_04241 [Vibrio aerogenes CECT 7868]|uniref:Uncharacterized protein n=1 Tax=Vibrio aerogenes CECT 7868 TaxID=1216006 RepID=A0A1M6DII8_9VIBR|nr:hypothetical protein [Vibrio aerogenes]SHI73002.1 hypothetical protein VA7868_04241 [Vibrio aerogenes CECT 7868]